jgi:hypothetical protein
VLYVEDNDYVRESVIERLGGHEREYIGCGDAETARTILATTPVQLLINRCEPARWVRHGRGAPHAEHLQRVSGDRLFRA